MVPAVWAVVVVAYHSPKADVCGWGKRNELKSQQYALLRSTCVLVSTCPVLRAAALYKHILLSPGQIKS